MHIIKYGKNGGCVRTTATEEMFEATYKPYGWEIDKELEKSEPIEFTDYKVKTSEDVQKIKNIETEKKTKKQVNKFTDNLIKKEK